VSLHYPVPVKALTNATLADGSRADLAIQGDKVAAVVPAGTPLPQELLAGQGEVLDLSGFLLVTAPAEPHGHLDKALSFDLIQPPLGDLDLAVESWMAYSATMSGEEIAQRARTAALRLLANGTTAVRTHVDLLHGGGDPLRGIEALVAVRESLHGLMDIQIVALGGWRSGDEVFEAALDLGADLVGGAPHMAPDPLGDLARLLRIAERRGVGVDLHTDESLSGALTLAEYAKAVRGWTVPLAAGHCVRLGTLEPLELEPVIAEVLASDIGIISLPITNLYLQGWQHEHSIPRGLTPVQRLLDAGVRVAGGADNIRDPFNPVGRCDALETASLLVSAGHLAPDDALRAVTLGARDVMSMPLAGPVEGARAELLAVRASNVGEAVAFAPGDRIVVHRGRLVSRSTHLVETALPGATPARPIRLSEPETDSLRKVTAP